MKNLFLLILILALISCKKDDKSGIEGDIKVHTINRMEVSYVDANSVDLLNQNNSNAFNHSAIKLYYLENGEKKFQDIYFSCEEALCFLRLYTMEVPLFLELDNQVTDTITSELIMDGANHKRKIWYNGELISDALAGSEFHFTIVK